MTPDPTALQATILKGHGRDFTAHVFVRWPGSVTRSQLRSLTSALGGITSAQAQQDAADRWRLDPTARTPPVRVVLLSAAAITSLGYATDALPDTATAFWEGMEARADRLADPPVGGEPASAAHALVVLADDSERVLEAEVDRLRVAAPGAAVHVEWGAVMRGRATATTYEPFGFADGMSDPVFRPGGWSAAPSGVWWSAEFPVDLVLVPFADGGHEGHGSFFVFRKLRQDVDGFRAFVAARARAAGTTTFAEGARAVGRDTGGTPLAEVTPGSWNDFSFATDPAGVRCPFSAHIRAVNPRRTEERWRQIARRGMPYRSLAGDGEVGLLFCAYMADIENQFEWMQRQANAAGDVLAGQGTEPQLTTLRDGQYFFAPPVWFF